jgi:hypothetical protein
MCIIFVIHLKLGFIDTNMKKEKQIVFRVNEEELELINRRMRDFNFRSVSEYCRFVSLNTQQIQVYTGTSLLKYASGGN